MNKFSTKQYEVEYSLWQEVEYSLWQLKQNKCTLKKVVVTKIIPTVCWQQPVLTSCVQTSIIISQYFKTVQTSIIISQYYKTVQTSIIISQYYKTVQSSTIISKCYLLSQIMFAPIWLSSF
jgi:hypothetical protein